jgi:membrane fusion protein, heavy metal efflux system
MTSKSSRALAAGVLATALAAGLSLGAVAAQAAQTEIVRAAADSRLAGPAPSLAAATPGAPGPARDSDPVAMVQGALHTAYHAVIWLANDTIDSFRNFSSRMHEAIYETAYMFGTNAVPVPRKLIDDPLPVLAPVGDAAAPAPQAAPPPAAAAKQQTAAVVAPAKSAALPPAITAPPLPGDATEAGQAETGPIDPGLLANFVYDRGARRPDGSFFVPKPLQRLFEVRTVAVATADVPMTAKLAGRIVPDPNAHGRVESSLLGRIEPPPDGLPVIGDSVHKGQILGYVEPAVGVVDRSQLRREVAQLTTAIRVETENLEILKQFSFVPFRDGKIYQSEQRLAGLRREREALLPMLKVREALIASTDGVISTSAAVPGRITHPGEMVFDIVNPKQLWIEASAPDPVTAEAASHVSAASALTPEGQMLAVSFIGSGLAVQQQSTPLLFRIENPPDGLRVGRPVTVSVQSGKKSTRGILLRRDAITVGSDGIQEVWEQIEPEVFLPHPVRTQAHDGQTVMVIDGLSDGAHVVTRGVNLMAQLQ